MGSNFQSTEISLLLFEPLLLILKVTLASYCTSRDQISNKSLCLEGIVRKKTNRGFPPYFQLLHLTDEIRVKNKIKKSYPSIQGLPSGLHKSLMMEKKVPQMNFLTDWCFYFEAYNSTRH